MVDFVDGWERCHFSVFNFEQVIYSFLCISRSKVFFFQFPPHFIPLLLPHNTPSSPSLFSRTPFLTIIPPSPTTQLSSFPRHSSTFLFLRHSFLPRTPALLRYSSHCVIPPLHPYSRRHSSSTPSANLYPLFTQRIPLPAALPSSSHCHSGHTFLCCSQVLVPLQQDHVTFYQTQVFFFN